MKQWLVNYLIRFLKRPNMSGIAGLENRFKELQKQNEDQKAIVAQAKAQHNILLEEQKELQAKLEERGIENLDEAKKELDRLKNEVMNEIMTIETRLENEYLQNNEE